MTSKSFGTTAENNASVRSGFEKKGGYTSSTTPRAANSLPRVSKYPASTSRAKNAAATGAAPPKSRKG